MGCSFRSSYIEVFHIYLTSVQEYVNLLLAEIGSVLTAWLKFGLGVSVL